MKMVFWAGVGTLFPFLMTTLGAALVFLMKKQSEDGPCMGFAAGVMSAAAVFSMILPAMRQNEGGWLIVTLGFMLGAAMIAGVDALMCRVRRIQNASDSARKRLMMVAAITLHNIPEGMAVGLAFALAGVQGGLAAAAVLALGIGVQNLPEGLAVALALRSAGVSRLKAVLIAAATGIFEPFGSLLGVGLSSGLAFSYPIGLGFAAGAMLFVVSQEVIPETHRNGHQTPATVGLMAGFALMMVLDTTLG